MSIEIETLAKKFESCRIKATGKKVAYPTKLRKAAASLVATQPAKTLANEFGVSTASIKAWAKAFTPNTISSDEMIPVEIGQNKEVASTTPEDVKVKIVCMEVSVPSSRLGTTLSDILGTMGASSC